MSESTKQWPPTDEQIKTIASCALNQSEKKDVSVLVYWENDPSLMIFEPFHFANTEYIKKKFECQERSVLVTVGRID
jgi:hypothetical protein